MEYIFIWKYQTIQAPLQMNQMCSADVRIKHVCIYSKLWRRTYAVEGSECSSVSFEGPLVEGCLNVSV